MSTDVVAMPIAEGMPIVKVLVAIDETPGSQKAVAFAAKLLAGRNDPQLSVTLFHVVESLPDFILAKSGRDSAGSAIWQVVDEWAQTSRTQGEQLLADQSQRLKAAGLPPAQVIAKLCQKECRPEAGRVVAALAIIEEMQQGNYDLVVIGRRGNSAAIPTFLGGVAEKVARAAQGRTLCVVD